MTSEVGQQTITLHILPNISRSKGIQAIKFGQLFEYKVKYFSSEMMQKIVLFFVFFEKLI